MHVLSRQFFNLAVIKAPLPDLIVAFSDTLLAVQPIKTELAFPEQPYHARPNDLPLVLWSPACTQELTAFMPHVSSGDYFVLEYACRRFGYSAVSVRSTTQDVEWPINEFIAYVGREEKRLVRAMKDAPRWDFYARGEPLPFEVTSSYAARFVRDRVRRDLLLSYSESWGAPILQREFWHSNQDAISFAGQNTV